jgi:heme/copper-type cytochrome/quinol oxidase subunit 2
VVGTLPALHLDTPVTLLTILLFAVVAGLLVQGVVFARQEVREAASVPRRTDMRLEVLWTAIAAGLLLAVFLSIRH